ncbi:MAG: PepSY domain-containing protein [Arenicellales bacterium]
MRKHLSKWHRRIGISAALIAIYLSITGLLLNHSNDLGLNNSRPGNTWLLTLYGIKPPGGISANTRQHQVDKLGEALFVDSRLIGQYESTLVGAVALEQLFVIAFNGSMLLLSPEREIIETLTTSNGLPGQIERIGYADANLLIKSGQQIYKSDEDLLNWLPVTELETHASWSKPQATLPATQARLKLKIPAYGPSWERVLQDLHSGRFFKLPGSLLVDLTGIVLLLLSISGIISFTLRNKAVRRKKQIA